jgi:hypothetical protein
MAKAKFDPKAKAKRQKIIAGVGGVLLLGLLAFQVPRTMKMLNAKPPADPVPVAAPSTLPTSDPSVLPTPGSSVSTGGGAAAPAGAGGGLGTLISSDVAPAPQAGQLIAFGRFASKDPFKQQIDPNALQTGGGGRGTAKSPSKPSTTTPKPDGGGDSGTGTGTGTGSGVVEPTTPGGPSKPSVPAGSAVIAVNGVEEVVALKASFPKDAPVFVLVSLSRGSAKIAIAGGAFASGDPTVTLKAGKAITLVNTADGTRYELKLVSAG